MKTSNEEALDKLQNKIMITWSALSYMLKNQLLTNEVIDDSFENLIEEIQNLQKSKWRKKV
jgi:hypothetical protein